MVISPSTTIKTARLLSPGQLRLAQCGTIPLYGERMGQSLVTLASHRICGLGGV
jgi:hypothetical protein